MPIRDDSWHDDVRLEVIRAVSERERHSLSANLIGWAICFAAALALPFGRELALPLTLRLVAIGSTRILANRLRRRLKTGRPLERDMRQLAASLGFAGMTWAMLVWPLMRNPPNSGLGYAPAVAIIGVTIVAVSLIASLLGPLPRIMAAFMACFVATLGAGAALSPQPVSPWAVTAVIGMLSGMIAFSLGSARDSRAVAETLVENRVLGQELAEALARAEFLSRRDPLTGLLNRRAFFEDVQPESGVSQLLAIDLDHFKRINDSFGHAVGDRVLVATAQVLRDTARELPGEDHRAARLGGEEFVLQLAGVEAAVAQAVADAARMRIGAIAAELDCPGLVVSASIGIAGCVAGDDLEAVLQVADEALYRAKQGGRDRVILAA